MPTAKQGARGWAGHAIEDLNPRDRLDGGGGRGGCSSWRNRRRHCEGADGYGRQGPAPFALTLTSGDAGGIVLPGADKGSDH
jgi:hypothetical protein